MARRRLSSKDNLNLVLDPPEELVFKGPFNDRCVCLLSLTNPGQTHVGFKMKCTAAKYYASSPAVGVIAPKDTTVISVFLSEIKPEDLATIEYKRHRFGITYLSVPNHSTSDDVDKLLKAASREFVEIAYLQSVIVAEDEEYKLPASEQTPTHPVTGIQLGTIPQQPQNQQQQRERHLTSSIDNSKPLPPKIATKPIRRLPSTTDYQQELQLKDSIIAEMQKEMEECKKQSAIMTEEMTAMFSKERSTLLSENQQLKLDMDNLITRKMDQERQLDNVTNMNRQLSTQQVNLQQEVNRLTIENEELKNDRFTHSIDTSDISFWEVNHKDITINEQLGYGSWGYVAKGVYKEQPVAVKCLHNNIVSHHTISLLKREVAVMAKVRHPCLLLFIAVSFNHPTGSPMIITELMECSLRDAYKKKGKLSVRCKMRIMMDVACALHYLHTHKERILHRDVSSANVLVYQNIEDTYRGKLSDFGSANFTRYAATAAPGTPMYMAPEVPRDLSSAAAPQTSKIDVYSYGVLLSEVFAEEPDIPITTTILKTFVDYIAKKFPFLHQQITKCIRPDPNDRPEIIDVLHALKEKFSHV